VTAPNDLVRELQRTLGVPVDGIYGANTHARVMGRIAAVPDGWQRRLQRALRVPDDGVIGTATLAALFRHMGAGEAASGLGIAGGRWMPAHGLMANINRLAEWFGEMAHESAGFTRLVENLNYTSAARIRAVWPSRFPTLASAAPFVRQPERLANFVYANRMGNGPPASGDGWRFRGRGIIHLTGRENYYRFGFEADPDAAAMPDNAVRAACAYWTERALNTLADAGQSDAISARINGKHPANGLEDRRARKAVVRALVT